MTCSRPRTPRPGITTFAALLAALAGLVLGEGRAAATDYYVAPNGSDSNPGTMAQPFLTVQKGADAGAAGDTVWFRAGTYKSSKQITFSKSGTSDSNRINYFAYTGEVPVFDFSTYVSPNTAVDEPTIVITGSWLHFKGLEVANGAVQPSGSHSNDAVRATNTHDNIFELLNIHNNFGPGLFINGGTGGHLILNCDSHDNYDQNGSQGDGQNGDGFGVHYQTTGPSTILRGDRAWINSDDGYDLISQEVPVTIENCWAVMNGYSNGGAGKPADGNGNGFKAGSSQTGIRHLLQNNVAWKNRAAGFYANHSTGGNTWYNNTSYMNAVQYNMLASPAGDPNTTITLTGSLVHIMRNNIGFPNKNSNMTGVDTAFNTWDLGISEASTDFASTSDSGYMGPRQADGSLPNIPYLHLAAGSPLIDKGTNVGLPYVGAAPDLGAYEYGATTTTGTGGSTGSTGGSTGSTGGTTGSTGGATGTGGKTGTGGTTGTGGKTGTGGVAGTGGVTGTGGITTTGTGGATTGTGGATAGSGGTTVAGTGGERGTGGTTAGTGGAVSGGTGGSSATGTGGAGGPDDTGSSGGCSCTVAPNPGPASFLILASFTAFALRRRRSRR